MADYISFLVYIVGAVAMALVIRATAVRKRLDRGAAFAACLLWPGALVIGVVAAVGIGFAAIFWPGTTPKGELR